MKKQNGITLIALIITIIVLLILAGVSISMLSGENGILTKATTAKEKNIMSSEQEQVNLAYTAASIEHNGQGATADELQKELDDSVGKGKTGVIDNGDGTLNVEFYETGHNYLINNGYIEETNVSIYGNKSWYAYSINEDKKTVNIVGFSDYMKNTLEELFDKTCNENSELYNSWIESGYEDSIGEELYKFYFEEINSKYSNLGILPRTIDGYSIESIDSNVFNNMGLKKISIPDSVTTIGDYAFCGNQLTSVTIPDSVTTIGDYAFCDNQLTSVTIPNSVATIGDCAFRFNQLTSATIPDSVTTIGDNAFSNNQLTSVIIPDSVIAIGEWAFYSNQLTSVIIPDSVTTIGGSAFRENKLTDITIPSSVKTIGGWAFMDNNITNVVIPSTIETMYCGGIFANNNLENVTFLGTPIIDEQNKKFTGMFYGNPSLSTASIKVPSGTLEYFKEISLSDWGLSSYSIFDEK